MQKDAEKPWSDTHSVLDALMRYVDNHIPWACFQFPEEHGCRYVIFKPHPKSIAHHIDIPNEKMSVNMMVELLMKLGTEFPMCAIGVIDRVCQIATGFVIHYKGYVILDYAEPDFFDKLDIALDHIKTHDGLSGVSLPFHSVPLSDQRSVV